MIPVATSTKFPAPSLTLFIFVGGGVDEARWHRYENSFKESGDAAVGWRVFSFGGQDVEWN